MIFESIVLLGLHMTSVEKQHSKSDRTGFLIKIVIESPEKSKFMIIFNYHYIMVLRMCFNIEKLVFKILFERQQWKKTIFRPSTKLSAFFS